MFLKSTLQAHIFFYFAGESLLIIFGSVCCNGCSGSAGPRCTCTWCVCGRDPAISPRWAIGAALCPLRVSPWQCSHITGCTQLHRGDKGDDLHGYSSEETLRWNVPPTHGEKQTLIRGGRETSPGLLASQGLGGFRLVQHLRIARLLTGLTGWACSFSSSSDKLCHSLKQFWSSILIILVSLELNWEVELPSFSLHKLTPPPLASRGAVISGCGAVAWNKLRWKIQMMLRRPGLRWMSRWYVSARPACLWGNSAQFLLLIDTGHRDVLWSQRAASDNEGAAGNLAPRNEL